MLTVKMQDIELTPQLYKTPIQLRSRELSAPVMENLYNNIILNTMLLLWLIV